MNIELFRLARGMRQRHIRWNHSGAFLELYGGPRSRSSSEVSASELKVYMGFLLGTFCASRQLWREGKLGFLDADVSGALAVLDQWQAMWSHMAVRDRRALSGYGFLADPDKFSARIRWCSAAGDLEPPQVQLWKEGKVPGGLWLDNLTRFLAHLQPTGRGQSFLAADYTVACVITVPHATSLVKHSQFARSNKNPVMGFHSYIHEDLLTAAACKFLLKLMDDAAKHTKAGWDFVWKHVIEHEGLTPKQQDRAGSSPALILLPQLYKAPVPAGAARATAVSVDGSASDEEVGRGWDSDDEDRTRRRTRHTTTYRQKTGPAAVWSVYNSTSPMDCLNFACGGKQGKVKLLEHITRLMQPFVERDQCMLLVLDWDTWRTVMRACMDMHGRGRHLTKHLILQLDHFHMLKYVTHSTVELLCPIRTLLVGVMATPRDELDSESTKAGMARIAKRAVSSLKGQQQLVSVLFMAYLQVRGVCAEAIVANRERDTFLRFLFDVFEVAVPLCVTAWVSYRKGRRKVFTETVVSLIPLLYCMHHPQYAAGIWVNTAFELTSNFALGDWYREQFVGFSAELGEMTLKPLSRAVAKNIRVLESPSTMKKKYVWEHHRQRCAERFNSATLAGDGEASSAWSRGVVFADDVRVERVAAWLRDLLCVCAKYPSRLSLPTRLHNYPGWTAVRKQVVTRLQKKVTKWFGDKLPGNFERNTDIPEFWMDAHDETVANRWKKHAQDGRAGRLAWQKVCKDYTQGLEREEPSLAYFSTYVSEHDVPKHKFKVKSYNLWTGRMALNTTEQELVDMSIKQRLVETIDVDYDEFDDSGSDTSVAFSEQSCDSDSSGSSSTSSSSSGRGSGADSSDTNSDTDSSSSTNSTD